MDEWEKVRREANNVGETIHVGSLHEFCTEKGSELAIDHPDRKYKGRVVFLGDRVTDQSGRIAVFEEMASNPATMEAGKMTDFYGCLRKCVINGDLTSDSQPSGLAGQKGSAGSRPSGSVGQKAPTVDLPFIIEQSDAAQAYCQAKLGGHTTWVRLPES